MACPYCGSRKVSEERTVQTFDLPDEWVAISQVRCFKCGSYYSKTIRDNLRTGRRKVTVSGDLSKHKAPAASKNARPGLLARIRTRIFRRNRHGLQARGVQVGMGFL